jgi:hypothetical protein
MKKIRSLLVLSLVFGILMALGVNAQSLAKTLTPVLNDLFDIVKLYRQLPQAFDFVLYLIFFMGFWRFAFSRVEAWKDQMNTNAVKSMYIVLGIISSIGITILEIRTNTSMEVLGPYFAFLFFLILSLLVLNFFGNKSVLGWGLVGLVLYGLLTMTLGAWFKPLQNQLWYNWFVTIAGVGGLICTIIGFVRIFRGEESNPLSSHGHTEPAGTDEGDEAGTEDAEELNEILVELDTQVNLLEVATQTMRDNAVHVLRARHAAPAATVLPPQWGLYHNALSDIQTPASGYLDKIRETLKAWYQNPKINKRTRKQSNRFDKLFKKFAKLLKPATIIPMQMRYLFMTGHPNPDAILQKIE